MKFGVLIAVNIKMMVLSDLRSVVSEIGPIVSEEPTAFIFHLDQS
jgi:hypothetical protein